SSSSFSCSMAGRGSSSSTTQRNGVTTSRRASKRRLHLRAERLLMRADGVRYGRAVPRYGDVVAPNPASDMRAAGSRT
ncbi:MAG TPA: hypothetical protein VIA18_25790, partial [Polyangia bacterium]|nr:hypothetical protein [Polyangia bacterium]